MSEYLPQTNEEMARLLAIERMLDERYPDDKRFVLEELADEEDVIDFLYSQLVQYGEEDPEAVLIEYGIIEENDEI